MSSMTGDGVADAGRSVGGSRPAWGVFPQAAFEERAQLLATILLDSVFVVVVALMNLGTSKALSRLELVDLDLFVVQALQVMLAVGTLSFVLISLARDVVVACARALRGI